MGATGRGGRPPERPLPGRPQTAPATMGGGASVGRKRHGDRHRWRIGAAGAGPQAGVVHEHRRAAAHPVIDDVEVDGERLPGQADQVEAVRLPDFAGSAGLATAPISTVSPGANSTTCCLSSPLERLRPRIRPELQDHARVRPRDRDPLARRRVAAGVLRL